MVPSPRSLLWRHWPTTLVPYPLQVGWLSTGGTLAMLLAVLIAFLKILALGPDSELPGVPERGAVVAAPSVDIKLVAFMDLCFSYGGAANWMR